MFFLLRVAFWLTVVLVLLPSGSGAPSAQAKVGAADAMVAAGAAVSDVSGFCDRRPDACEVGAQTAAAIGARAQAGAKMVYDYFSDHAAHVNDTGSVSKRRTGPPAPKIAAVRTVPASLASQNTLKGGDLEPAWQGPTPVRSEVVPLPRRAPHRKA